MRGEIEGLLRVALAAVFVSLAAVAARAQEPGEDDELSVTQRMTVATEEAKAAARAEGIREALADAPEVAFLVRGGVRDQVVAALVPLLRDERVRERGGRFSLLATLSRQEVLQVVLDVVAPEKSWARDPVALEVIAGGDGRWSAEELSQVRAAAGDQLRRYRFSVAAGADAPLVCTIQGGFSAGPRGLGLDAALRAYHRATNTILAELSLRADPAARGAQPGVVQARGDDPEGRAAMARDVGRAAVMALVQRLNDEESTKGEDGGPRDAHELRLVGWSDEEAEAIIDALITSEGFAGWQDVGAAGSIRVLRCSVAADEVVRLLEAALDVAGKRALATVGKERGLNVVTITRKRG